MSLTKYVKASRKGECECLCIKQAIIVRPSDVGWRHKKVFAVVESVKISKQQKF